MHSKQNNNDNELIDNFWYRNIFIKIYVKNTA